jgi:hypothetical protein
MDPAQSLLERATQRHSISLQRASMEGLDTVKEVSVVLFMGFSQESNVVMFILDIDWTLF